MVVNSVMVDLQLLSRFYMFLLSHGTSKPFSHEIACRQVGLAGGTTVVNYSCDRLSMHPCTFISSLILH